MSEKTNKDLDINKEVLDLITVVKSIVEINENLSKEVERLNKEVATFKSSRQQNSPQLSEELKNKFVEYLLGKVANPELLEDWTFKDSVEQLCSTFSPELLLVICLTLRHGEPLESVIS